MAGLSYASLGSRYPRAGGAAYITQRAYRRSLLTHVVGLTVACSGLTSIAAGARVVGENLQALPAFEGLPTGALAFVYVAIVGAVAYRGTRESMWAKAQCCHQSCCQIRSIELPECPMNDHQAEISWAPRSVRAGLQ